LNAVLRGVVLAAEKQGWEVVGFRDGFEGLLAPGNHVILDRENTNGIMALGGTIIGTTNRGHFVAKTGAGARMIEGHFGSMVSYQNYQVRHVPIAEAVNRLKLVPPNGELVQTARDMDISFGD
jgi:6-phosphofructokinase